MASAVERAPPTPEPEPAPAPPTPRPVVHRATRPERIPTAEELPTPPSDDPGEYAAWSKALTSTQRHQIALFCRANPIEYEASCGGIGPLHVPVPPSLLPRARDDHEDRHESKASSRSEWFAMMSREQQSWVTATCEAHYNQGALCTVDTPLVVSLDNDPVVFVGSWPTARTPWIALDANHDGAISMAELFGSWTVMPDGTTAHDGFAALAQLDANHDGVIDAADPAFSSLLLWADDGDRRATPDELRPLDATIVSISLAAHLALACDRRGNCEGTRATLVWRDAAGTHTGSVIDVSLAD